jgi:hypothetical protein
MALTVERRNQIAWKIFVQFLRERDVCSILDTCSYFSREYKIPNNNLLYLAVEKAYIDILYSCSGESCELQENEIRNEFVWLFNISRVIKKGIIVDAGIKRQVGKKTSKNLIARKELNNYYHELLTELVNVLGKNDLQRLEKISHRIEMLEEKCSTSKVNSAEAGS